MSPIPKAPTNKGLPPGHLEHWRVSGSTSYGNVLTPRHTIIRHGKIEISTQPLDMRALTKKALDAALDRKNADDQLAYGKSTEQLRADAMSKFSAYFASEPHIAWSLAAEARTGGRISSPWWMNFDPFGGSAGNGPNILAANNLALGGKYPGLLSRISMAHDTDWSLGRYFKAGPLFLLYDKGPRGKDDMAEMGAAGLSPINSIVPFGGLYTLSRQDWKVTYHF